MLHQCTQVCIVFLKKDTHILAERLHFRGHPQQLSSETAFPPASIYGRICIYRIIKASTAEMTRDQELGCKSSKERNVTRVWFLNLLFELPKSALQFEAAHNSSPLSLLKTDLKMFLISQRTTEWLEGHAVQHPCWSRATYSRLPRTTTRQLLNMPRDKDSISSTEDLFQCLSTLMTNTYSHYIVYSI